MRFKTRTAVLDETRRIVTKFAWFPITLNGDTRWLERVSVEEVFKENGRDGCPNRWWPIRFADQHWAYDTSRGFYIRPCGTAAPVPPRPSFTRMKP